MTRSIITAAEWTLAADTGEGETPGVVHSAECLSCGATSPPTAEERLPVEVWALKHTGSHPEHRRFRATVATPWQVTPAEGNPYRERDEQRVSAQS